MSNDYEKQTPRQRANLQYGGKLRYARSLPGQVSSGNMMYPGMYTDEETRQVQAISAAAIERAKKAHEEAIAQLDQGADCDSTKADRRAETIDREHSGQQPEG